jgi:hypothetical protein
VKFPVYTPLEYLPLYLARAFGNMALMVFAFGLLHVPDKRLSVVTVLPVDANVQTLHPPPGPGAVNVQTEPGFTRVVGSTAGVTLVV